MEDTPATENSTPVCDLCGSSSAHPIIHKFDMEYVECDHCQHVFANTTNFDFSAYNESANAALTDTHSAKHDSERYQKAYAALLDRFDNYRNSNSFVELGCSSGAFLRRAAIAGWQAIGIEPVADSARAGIEQYDLDIRIGTLDDAKLESDSADVFYSNAVIEHLDSPASVVTEAARVLRPGGLFYADTVNLASYTWRFLGDKWKLVDPRMHLHLFTPQSLTKLCEDAGLTVVDMTTHGVRFHATRADKPTGPMRIVDELRKAPYSFAARRNLKGDNIAVYAEKR